MRRKQKDKKIKSDQVRPKKKREYPTRQKTKDTLRNWESTDWEDLTSDNIEGKFNARDDSE